MTKEQAYRVLGLDRSATAEERKKAYRARMRQFHPDSAGESQSAHELAQMINEAYLLIKDEEPGEKAKTRSWKDLDPGILINPAAFCERGILLQEEMLGTEHVVDTGLKGRFYWDPEVETFELLLRSVNMAVTEILAGYDLDDRTMFKYRSGLLHLLLQEFIHPLQVINDYPPIKKSEGEYLIHCGVKLFGRAGNGPYKVIADTNKLYAMNGTECVAQISFIENALYYIVTPLIIQKVANASLKIDANKKGILTLRLTDKSYRDASLKINDRIRDILSKLGEV